MISILVTGVGSLLGQGILKSIQNSRLKCRVIGTDYFPSAVGLYWVDEGYILPDILKQNIQEISRNFVTNKKSGRKITKSIGKRKIVP